MNAERVNWPHESICLDIASFDVESLAVAVHRSTCRVHFDAPGFCVVTLGPDVGSVGCRGLMVALKRELAKVHESATGNTLTCLSAGRFDQQETTRFHLDGGPDESLLMLGYERSAIDSGLEIADYSRCALDLGLSPAEFMVKHNPMFDAGDDILRPYTTRVPCFSRSEYRIVCINNSCSPYSESEPVWQGVLHGAIIPKPDERKRRVVNSMMIAPAPAGTADTIAEEALNEFVTTSEVRSSQY